MWRYWALRTKMKQPDNFSREQKEQEEKFNVGARECVD